LRLPIELRYHAGFYRCCSVITPTGGIAATQKHNENLETHAKYCTLKTRETHKTKIQLEYKLEVQFTHS